MGQDGKAAYVVVGVGGFLGIGEKDVAISFDRVTFSQDPMPRPTAPAGDQPPPGTMAMRPAGDVASNTGMAPNSSVGLGSPVTTNGAGGVATVQNPPPGEAMTTPLSPRSSAYPNQGMVDLTADQLKAAPAFRYAK